MSKAKSIKIFLLLLLIAVLFASFYIIYTAKETERYKLIMGAGNSNGARYKIAEILTNQAKNYYNIDITLINTQGSEDVVEQMENDTLQIGLIQGGLKGQSHIKQISALVMEPLHLLVKPNLKNLTDLKNKRLNLSVQKSGTRLLAEKILEFVDIKSNTYTDEAMSYDEIMKKRSPNELPDAIFAVSLLPAPIAEFLIKQFDYHLMALPYGAALSQRDVWIRDTVVPAYSYGEKQNQAVQTIGTKMLFIARDDVEPEAITRLLSLIYSVNFIQETNLPLVETTNPDVLPEYPPHEGVTLFKSRKDPLLTQEFMTKLIRYFPAFILILIGAIIIVVIIKLQQQEVLNKINPLRIEVCDIESELAKGGIKTSEIEDKRIRLINIGNELMSNFDNHPQMPILQTYIDRVLKSIDRLLKNERVI